MWTKSQSNRASQVNKNLSLRQSKMDNSFQRQESNCQLEAGNCQVVSKRFMVSIISPRYGVRGEREGGRICFVKK